METCSQSGSYKDFREWMEGVGGEGPEIFHVKEAVWERLWVRKWCVVSEKPAKGHYSWNKPERRIERLRGVGVWGGSPRLCYRFGHLFHDSLILGLLLCTSSNISVEFPTHWFNGILSLWLFICMVLFDLLLIINCFTKNTETS